MAFKWYIDTFVLNLFLVDLVVFLLTVYLTKRSGRVLRCLLCALCSAASETLLYLVMPYYFLYRVFMLVGVNSLITVGLTWPYEKKTFLSGYILITALFLFVGGVQTLLLYWVPLEHGLGIWHVALAIAAVCFCWLQHHKGRELARQYQVELLIGSRHILVNACLDTGNFLRDPYTGKPVSVVSLSALKMIDLEEYMLRYIPYHTIGQEHAMMQVMTIDKMIIKQQEKRMERIQPVIGLAKHDLFLDEDIQMILHSEMI